MIIIGKTIEKYIENKYYDEIFNRCKGFILGHKSQLQFKSYLVLDASYVELDDIHVRSVIFKGEPGNHNIQFNACIEADVILKGFGQKSYEADSDSVWLKVSFFGILFPQFLSVDFYYISKMSLFQDIFRKYKKSPQSLSLWRLHISRYGY